LQKEADGLRKAVLAREAELHEQQQLAAAAAREAGQQQQRLETKLLKREKRLQEKEARLKATSNCVIGDVRVAPLGTVNAAGTINSAGNRVDVDFRRITFSLDEIFGRPVSFRKVIVTKQAPAAAQPANDVTYLDETLRITRGGDDSLFIFRREASPRALLTAAEREALYAEGGNEATLFGSNGVSSASAAPELRKLIDE
jgi:hypothetical protein